MNPWTENSRYQRPRVYHSHLLSATIQFWLWFQLLDFGKAAKGGSFRGVQPAAHGPHAAQDGYEHSPTQNRKLKTLWEFCFCFCLFVYFMCGPRQLISQCGPEMPKGWTPLLSIRPALRVLIWRAGERMTEENWLTVTMFISSSLQQSFASISPVALRNLHWGPGSPLQVPPTMLADSDGLKAPGHETSTSVSISIVLLLLNFQAKNCQSFLQVFDIAIVVSFWDPCLLFVRCFPDLKTNSWSKPSLLFSN